MIKRYFTQEEKDYIICQYPFKTAKELAIDLNCKTQKIQDTVKQLELHGTKIEKNRKYQANFSYFETIDTSEKAYWLGFIYADGNVGKRENQQGSLSIKLNQKDKILLELFKKDIEAENPVFEERIDKRSKSMMSGIFIVSDKIFNDLGNLNCIPRKTFKIDSIPNGVPYNLISHFIRGYFDGDGSVNFNKDKSLIFQIVGQEEFLIKNKNSNRRRNEN